MSNPESIANVSGWYGPVAYLSWLITAYAASVSSIWHSSCSVTSDASDALDPDLLLTLLPGAGSLRYYIPTIQVPHRRNGARCGVHSPDEPGYYRTGSQTISTKSGIRIRRPADASRLCLGARSVHLHRSHLVTKHGGSEHHAVL
ncbi:hypothetical protein QBC43DRAFT_306553 [Cladorrhinum sp. PSN259]|nr:hypothetical protein QBC43DRAFT_306553 [Cladorrhinum sp. PSN259]